jgi:hypothetical protein
MKRPEETLNEPSFENWRNNYIFNGDRPITFGNRGMITFSMEFNDPLKTGNAASYKKQLSKLTDFRPTLCLVFPFFQTYKKQLSKLILCLVFSVFQTSCACTICLI